MRLFSCFLLAAGLLGLAGSAQATNGGESPNATASRLIVSTAPSSPNSLSDAFFVGTVAGCVDEEKNVENCVPGFGSRWVSKALYTSTKSTYVFGRAREDIVVSSPPPNIQVHLFVYDLLNLVFGESAGGKTSERVLLRAEGVGPGFFVRIGEVEMRGQESVSKFGGSAVDHAFGLGFAAIHPSRSETVNIISRWGLLPYWMNLHREDVRPSTGNEGLPCIGVCESGGVSRFLSGGYRFSILRSLILRAFGEPFSLLPQANSENSQHSSENGSQKSIVSVTNPHSPKENELGQLILGALFFACVLIGATYLIGWGIPK